MKQIKQTILHWLFQWFVILWVLITAGVVFAVNSWDTLTATMWNDLTTKVDTMDTHRYKKSYYVSSSVSAPIVNYNGDNIPYNTTMKIYCWVLATSTTAASYRLTRINNAWVITLEKLWSFSSTTSNTPELFNNGWVLSIRLYNHTSQYTVKCIQEELY